MKIMGLGMAAALAFSAAPASAATTITFTNVLGAQVGAFGNLNPSGTNTDEYTFDVGTGGLAGFVGSVGARLFGTNLDFTSVTLNGTPFTINSRGVVELRTISLPISGPQTLSVSYANAQRFSSYGGALTFTPMAGGVPEPATWGMMILGFGAVGGALRARRRKTTIAYA